MRRVGPEPSPAAVTPGDMAAVRLQLGRPPRSVHAVAHRCGCGLPDVVTTAPRLPDGAPFPTTFYLTCPRANSAIGRLEGAGVMATMTGQLRSDPGLAAGHRAAHRAYLSARARLGQPPEIADVSAGGMPDRVKCLHALAAHELAEGPDVNPIGAQVVAELDADGRWGGTGPCVNLTAGNLRLRLAGPADLDSYLRIRDDAARRMLAAGIRQWRPEEHEGPAAAAAAAELFVADLGGVVFGGVQLARADPEVWPEVPAEPGAGFVHGLVVDRSLAGRGLGRRVLDAAAAVVADRGGHRLRLDCWAGNDRLRRWYEQAGFTELDVREVAGARPVGQGQPTPVVRFVREVRPAATAASPASAVTAAIGQRAG